MSKTTKIIIDTDGGSDDTMAIAMALHDTRYQTIMITTVAGNVPCAQATQNVLFALELCQTYYPPVYQGVTEMLIRKWVGAADVHGLDGLGDCGYKPTHLNCQKGHAVVKILETLRRYSAGQVDIIALGPLTNLALAVRLDLATMKKARRIIVMGSAGLGTGNVTPAAEFNLWQDPEAAKIVLDAGLNNLIFVGWDACLGESMLDEKELTRLENSGPLGKFCVRSNQILIEMNKQRFGRPCLDMADPAAVAAALNPICIKTCDPYFCEMDTSSGPSAGSLLVDVCRFSNQKSNAFICSQLHATEFKEYVFKMLNA